MTTENENQNNETEAAAPASAPAEQTRPPRPFNRPPRPGFRPGGPGAGTEEGEGAPEGGQPGGGGGFGGGGYGGRSGGPGGARRPRRPGGGKERFAPRRKVCQFCVDQIKEVDYKDFQRLRRFLSDRGKIEPRRKTGTCARHQRSLTTAIKRGRYMALLPYVVNQSR